MKLMVRVRPGVELTCATFWPSRELIRLDLPTLERPRKANSGGPSGGKNFGSAAEVRNLAITGFMSFILSLRSKPLEVAAHRHAISAPATGGSHPSKPKIGLAGSPGFGARAGLTALLKTISRCSGTSGRSSQKKRARFHGPKG